MIIAAIDINMHGKGACRLQQQKCSQKNYQSYAIKCNWTVGFNQIVADTFKKG